MADGRVLMERDAETGIARITLNNPERRNSYDAAMRGQLSAFLDDLAADDDIKVVLFHRLGPVLTRRMLLTGDCVPASSLEHLGIFTEVLDDDAVAGRAEWYARKVARMPADGIVIAKEAFRLVEQLQGYQGEEVTSYLIHAFGTNIRFEDGEFNFVKARAEHGVKQAFGLRDQHFDVPEADA